jgi:hypothetical protein
MNKQAYKSVVRRQQQPKSTNRYSVTKNKTAAFTNAAQNT